MAEWHKTVDKAASCTLMTLALFTPWAADCAAAVFSTQSATLSLVFCLFRAPMNWPYHCWGSSHCLLRARA